MSISRTPLSRVNESGDCPACGAPGDEAVFIVEMGEDTLAVECDHCGWASDEYDISDLDKPTTTLFTGSVELHHDGEVAVDGRTLSDIDGITVFDPTV